MNGPPSFREYEAARAARRREARAALALVFICAALFVAGMIGMVVKLWRQL